MIFNSLDFAIFLPLVFLTYWFVCGKSVRWQNVLIVVASYIFYGWWDWRFLSLILFSTVVDYTIGLMLGKSESDKDRKALLWMSLAVNLGLLGVFKYYNFFTENFTEAFRFFGMVIQPNMLKIILPVGISFYTFQTLSYTIDVYREKLEPTKDFISFAAFVSFFPQLVAGPIERATHLLPQFYQERKFDYGLATEGMRQILWGLFKKVVIADNCAQYANNIFANSADHSGSTLVLGALFFTFQIYGDFSGYSDIAIGTARLFGFDLMQNFAYPYFSRDIAEFWRRWHISLSTWFRDYLYIPLGGSRGNLGQTVRNIFIIFVVSGFWHGANWTFIAWGALNAIYFLPLLLLNLNRNNMGTVAAGRFLPTLRESFAMGVTFGLTVLAWIFFRAESISHAFAYLGGILDASLISLPEVLPKKVLLLVFFFLLVEWLGREESFAFGGLPKRMSRPLRWTTYYCIIGMIVFFAGDQESFIYFQF